MNGPNLEKFDKTSEAMHDDSVYALYENTINILFSYIVKANKLLSILPQFINGLHILEKAKKLLEVAGSCLSKSIDYHSVEKAKKAVKDQQK